MRNKILIILSFFCFSISAQIKERDIREYPSYERVFVHFFTNHSFNKYFSDYYFSFEKSPEGWFVNAISKTNSASVLRTPIWDFSSKQYVLAAGEVRNSIATLQKYINQSNGNYSIFPFYGYKNFENDIIKYFEELDVLSDSMLLALGLVNSNLAAKECRRIQNGLPRILNDVETKPIDTTKIQRISRSIRLNNRSYIKPPNMQWYIDMAITHYKNLQVQNRAFIFKNKSIKDHAGIEEVKFAILFESLRNIRMSTVYWKGIEFSEGVLNYAKNTLYNCDSNTILFTNSDIETYPIMLMQQEGIRKDVWVVNLPLLQQKWYKYYLFEGLDVEVEMSKDSILNKLIVERDLFSLPFEMLCSERLQFTKMQRGKFTKSTDELFDILKNKPDSSLIWHDEGLQIQFIKSRNINYSPKKDGYEVLFKTNEFLEAGPLAMIGLIHKYGKVKKIAFTDGYGMKSYGIEEKFLKKKGLIYELKYVHRDFSGSYPLEVGLDESLKFINEISWNPLNFSTTPSSPVLFNYTGLYTRLIDAYIKKGATEDAKKVILILENKVDLMKIPAHFNSFYLISLYKDLGNQAKVRKFTTHTVEDYLRQYNEGDADTKIEIESLVNKMKSILNYDSSFLMQELNRTFHFL
jgi:hypothetical protein